MKNTRDPKTLLNGLKVVIIDDSKAFAAGIAEILKAEGCLVTSYTTAITAISEIKTNPPDIILTDLEMPEVSGSEVILSIKSEKDLESIPILVLTSKCDNKTLTNTMFLGADSFIGKESVKEVLVANLISLARIRKLHLDIINLKQFHAIKSLIGTYKHEFGNALAILEGKLNKLQKINSIDDNEATWKSIHVTVNRFKEVLKRLDEIKHYEETPYSDESNIVKISGG